MKNEPTNPLPPGKKAARKPFEFGGVGKGSNWRGQMFSIEYKTGNLIAFPYPYVQRISFDKSGKLEIETATAVIEVGGRNLSGLYMGLLDHHIREIVENDERFEVAAEGEAFIDKIKVTKID